MPNQAICFDFYGVLTANDENLQDTIIKLSKKFKLFIVSNTYLETITEYLDQQGLRNYFTEIFPLDLQLNKVEKFNLITKKYKLPAAEIIFITDSEADIQEAKQAQIGWIIEFTSADNWANIYQKIISSI